MHALGRAEVICIEEQLALMIDCKTIERENKRLTDAHRAGAAAFNIEVPERAHLAPRTCLDRKMLPFGYIFLTLDDLQHDIPAREQVPT